MLVYTFSTGGCRDAIYLDKLSSTKQGVKELIKNSDVLCLDDKQKVRDIFIDFNTISVVIDDYDLMDSFTKRFELVSFEVD